MGFSNGARIDLRSGSANNFGSLASKAGDICFYTLLIAAPSSARWEVVSRHGRDVYPEFASALVYASDVIVLACIVFWLIGWALSSDERQWMRPHWLIVPVLAFAILAWLAAWGSQFPPVAAETSLRLGLLGAVTILAADRQAIIGGAAIALAAGALAHGGIAAAQFVLQGPLGLAWLGEFQAFPHTPGAALVEADGAVTVRSYGLATSPNLTGGYLAVALCVVFRRLGAASRRSVPLLLGATCVGTVALMATFSRSAWLGLGIGLVATIALGVRTQALPVRRLCLGLSVILVSASIIAALQPGVVLA